jgi:hypothetical protein
VPASLLGGFLREDRRKGSDRRRKKERPGSSKNHPQQR